MNQVTLRGNHQNTAGPALEARQGMHAPSRCSGPPSSNIKASDASGTNSLTHFKRDGPPGSSAFGKAASTGPGGRQPNGHAGQVEGASTSVTKHGPLLVAPQGPRGLSEGQQPKIGTGAPMLVGDQGRGHQNPVGTPGSTLLKNRKDQHYLSSAAAGTAPGSLI